MTRTAFHRKLNTLTMTSPDALVSAVTSMEDTLIKRIKQQSQIAEANASGRHSDVLNALRVARPPDIVLTNDIRELLSGLTQVEVQTLDKDATIETNNEVMRRHLRGRRLSDRAQLLKGEDSSLPESYRAAFAEFVTGDANERGARLQTIFNVRERILRHFALQQASQAKK